MTVLENVANKALAACWQVVVEEFPWATSGDLAPAGAVALSTAATAALDDWIANNAATQASDVAIGYRFQLLRPIDGYPAFFLPRGLTGEVTAIIEWGVWVRLDQAVAGAKPWDNQVHWQTIDEFAWHTIPA